MFTPKLLIGKVITQIEDSDLSKEDKASLIRDNAQVVTTDARIAYKVPALIFEQVRQEAAKRGPRLFGWVSEMVWTKGWQRGKESVRKEEKRRRTS